MLVSRKYDFRLIVSKSTLTDYTCRSPHMVLFYIIPREKRIAFLKSIHSMQIIFALGIVNSQDTSTCQSCQWGPSPTSPGYGYISWLTANFISSLIYPPKSRLVALSYFLRPTGSDH
uniref:Uncharacterized protein n=1 Tax=Kalanchoe fedtschenkoi TaxID=63787 RepID=A0A7N0USX2_KALFE